MGTPPVRLRRHRLRQPQYPRGQSLQAASHPWREWQPCATETRPRPRGTFTLSSTPELSICCLLVVTNVPQWPVAVEARSPAAALIAVNVSEVDDVGRELMKRLRRPKRVSPALPTPVASGPYPTVAVPDPASRNPSCAHIRCRDICARHPDILDAIPAPAAGLPDISGGRRSGHRLDHGRGRGDADDHANARETRTGRERQYRSAEKGKDRSSVHAGDPGSCFSSVKPSTDAAGVLP